MQGEKSRGIAHSLSEQSNCEIVRSDENRIEFRFPDGEGRISPAQWEFRDRAELIDYLAELLSLDVVAGGLRGSAVQRGKYQRHDARGRRSFTLGDPILDLITSPSGQLVVAGKTIDLSSVELSSARNRAGGILSIDLSSVSRALLERHIVEAAIGQGQSAIIECTGEVVALASINPSQRDFYRSGDHLRFKAWRKNYTFYWSMGAEIETWGHDFDSARIESRYLDTVAGQVCSAVKFDSDNDSDDDYVDEYEWGVNAPQPLRVVSNCTADWHGEDFGGQVAAGQECFEV